MMLKKQFIKILICTPLFAVSALAADAPTAPVPETEPQAEEVVLPKKANQDPTGLAQKPLGASSGFVQKSEEETLDVPKNRKFVYLTIGVEYDEKTREMPPVIKFKGDFKKVTEATYSKEFQAIHFVPRREGVASLLVKDKKGKVVAEYRIIVRKSKLDAVAREIQSLLGDVEGITVRILNNKVIVDGQVLLPGDMARVVSVLGQFGSDQASSLVTMSPIAMKKIAEFIAKDINNPEIEVAAKNDKILLSGFASSENEKLNAETIAKSYMPPIVADSKEVQEKVQKRKPVNEGVINLIAVKQQAPPPPPKMVQVVLHYVELAKDYQKGFRFQFMPDIGDQNNAITVGGANTSAAAPFTATISNLFPKLNWSKSHGHARVLEAGSVMVKDGEQAKFSRTTKMPTNSVAASGQVAQSGGEKVGIETTVKPTTTGERSDSVDLTLDFSIDAPAGTSGTGLIVASNKISTQLIVRSTQSAAIGGLIENNSVTAYNKFPPGVSQNPIISLYTSRDFTHKQSQFVVFVTPIIRSTASTGAEKIKQKFKLNQ